MGSAIFSGASQAPPLEAPPPEPPLTAPLVRVMAMPADANPNGDIFGGWLLAQMDLAGGNLAVQRARGRCATVAVDGMVFHQPVYVGDEVSCYGELVRTGKQLDDDPHRGMAPQSRDRRDPPGHPGDVHLCGAGRGPAPAPAAGAALTRRSGSPGERHRLDQPAILVLDVADPLVDRPDRHPLRRIGRQQRLQSMSQARVAFSTNAISSRDAPISATTAS